MMGNDQSLKKAFSSLILIFVLIPFSKVLLCAQDLSIPKAVVQVGAKVVEIRRYDKKGDCEGRGSGFFIDPEKILTCEHVIEGAYSVEIEYGKSSCTKVTILKKDENSDLALLKVNCPSEVGFLSFEKGQEVNLNQQIVAIGYPANSVKFFSEGSVTKDEMGDEIHNIQISAAIYNGMSGSPVLNLNGRVIGVCYRAVNYKKEYYAIGIKTIKEFLNKPDNPQKLHEAESVVFYIAVYSAVAKKTSECLRWLINIPISIYDFVFFHGKLRGIFIIIFSSGLFIWTSRIIHKYKLLRVFQSKKRKSVAKRISKFYCWKCGRKIRVSSFQGSDSAKCRRCETILEIPAV
jgi:hypothetical protein